MRNAFDFVVSLPIVIVAVVVPWVFLVATDTTVDVSINKDYKLEYDECQEQLDKRIPDCAPVKCTEGWAGYMWSIFGFAVMVYGFFYWNKREKELKKLKEEGEPQRRRRKRK